MSRRSIKRITSKEWLSYWDPWHKNSGPNKSIVMRKTRVKLKQELKMAIIKEGD